MLPDDEAGCGDAVVEVGDNSDDASEMVREMFVVAGERKYPRAVCWKVLE